MDSAIRKVAWNAQLRLYPHDSKVLPRKHFNNLITVAARDGVIVTDGVEVVKADYAELKVLRAIKKK